MIQIINIIVQKVLVPIIVIGVFGSIIYQLCKVAGINKMISKGMEFMSFLRAEKKREQDKLTEEILNKETKEEKKRELAQEYEVEE